MPLEQPKTLRDPKVEARLAGDGADGADVDRHGGILPQEILEMPTLGCGDEHAALFPLDRGAAPIAGALLQVDSPTGISLLPLLMRACEHCSLGRELSRSGGMNDCCCGGLRHLLKEVRRMLNRGRF